ncbi:MAG: hypothetical protein HYV45_00355 [Candidatus Moranbacteria bacterium]|nr:hypothetical protein [Candidatus Moranbacteria bacterium]
MESDEIKKRIAEIEEIYHVYLKRLLALKKEQDKVITDFEKVLRSERIKEIKKSLGL